MQKTTHTIGEYGIFAERTLPDKKTHEAPIVFVHGSFGGYFMWNMFVEYFAKHGYECIALSLRGHAPSKAYDLGTLLMHDYVDDVRAVIEELAPANPVIVGHSMGGLVALMYAAEYGVSRVVAIDPSPTQEVAGAKSEEEVAAMDIPDMYDVAQAGMPQNPEEAAVALSDISPEMRVKMKEMLGPESGSARRDRKRGISVPKDGLTMPTLMLGAELGKSLPFGIAPESTKAMADYYGAQFVEIPKATHPGVIMGEHAQDTMRAVEEFFTS